MSVRSAAAAAHVATTATHVTATHVTAAHVAATAEPPAVSTPTTVSTPASPRERVSGQSPCESGGCR